ncbi:MAG: hypothetical protein IJA27_08285 [Lachnospiraceae bacterium]|nr:hypothetical protein [Lachnospiraceae bacterium]
MELLFDTNDLESILNEFNAKSDNENDEFINASMSDEMKASQKRYEDYIKKHQN